MLELEWAGKVLTLSRTGETTRTLICSQLLIFFPSYNVRQLISNCNDIICPDIKAFFFGIVDFHANVCFVLFLKLARNDVLLMKCSVFRSL